MSWTVQKLCDSFRDLTPRKALLIIGIVRGRIDPAKYAFHPYFRGAEMRRYVYIDGGRCGRIEKKMAAVNHLLECHGVEAIEAPEGADADCPYGYFDGLIALYCNSGDTYATTIAYIVETMRYRITTMGDIIEEYEARQSEHDCSGDGFAGVDHGNL